MPRGKPFAKGHDPRRHILSRRERQKGYDVAMHEAKMPSRVRAWLKSKLRRWRHAQNGSQLPAPAARTA
jgi:hypothetical protein